MAYNPDHWETIYQDKLYLTENVKLNNSDLWVALIKEEVISHKQYEGIINTCKTNSQQVDGLLGHLSDQKRCTFDKFLECLEKHKHKHVADRIRESERRNTRITQEKQTQGEKLIDGIKQMNFKCVQQCKVDGADVNYQNKNGLTALMVALQSGSRMMEVIKELLRGGALESLCPEAIFDQVKENVCTVFEYLDGRETLAKWTTFIECLKENDHSHVAANLELYVPEAFTDGWTQVTYKRKERDPATEDLRKSFKRLSRLSSHPVLDEPNLKSQLKVYSYKIVFEGSSSEREYVRFLRYNGPFIGQHIGLRLYEPMLLKVYGFGSGLDYFKEYFRDQIHQIKSEHEEHVHGNLVIHGRLGKLYIFDHPDVEKMTIAELNKWQHISHFQMDGGFFRWAFAPSELSHERLKIYLAARRFELYNTEKRYILNLKIDPYEYRVVLDEQLQYIETRHPNAKWLALPLKRADVHHRDIRVDITTTQKVPGNSKMDTIMRKTKILEFENDTVIIRKEYANVCVFLRHKITQMYRQKMDTKCTFATEVHLVTTQNHTFMLEEGHTVSSPWGTEVIVLPTLPEVREREVMETFSDDFLKFCSDLDQAAG